MELRTRATGLVTCSDASEEGGGVCWSSVLTGCGRLAAWKNRPEAPLPLDSGILLVDLFGGIGGARAALDLLGVRLAGHISCEFHKGAAKVVKTRWPEVREWGDVTDLDADSFERLPMLFPWATLILVTGGSPCQDVSSANIKGAGHTGSRSCLFMHIRRVARLLQQLFRYAKVKAFLENVASMTSSDQQAYSKNFGSPPIWLCPSNFAWARRPRYYWTDWQIHSTNDVKVHHAAQGNWGEITCEKIPVATWAEKGAIPWDGPSAEFAVFMRAKTRKTPPFVSLGEDRCDKATLDRWHRDAHRYPPYQYLLSNGMRTVEGEWRMVTAQEKELLCGFPKHHTEAASSKTVRHSRPREADDVRHQLLGNTYQVHIVAWLFGQCLVDWDLIDDRPCMSDCLAGWDGRNAPSVSELSQEQTTATNLGLVRALQRAVSHKGGYLRV